MAESKGEFKQSFKGTFGKIFARTDIPIKVKQNAGQTVKVKNITYVSGSKTWKAKAETAAQLNYTNTSQPALQPPAPRHDSQQHGVNLDFHVQPHIADGSASTARKAQNDETLHDDNNSTTLHRVNHGNNNNNRHRQDTHNAMSAKYIQSSHPDVEYFQQRPKEVAVTSDDQPSPRGRKLERRESERVWNAYSKNKNTYRHQYFIQKTKNLEDDEEVIALMNREPSPLRVDVNREVSPPQLAGRHSPPRRQQSRQSVLEQLSPEFQKQLSGLLKSGDATELLPAVPAIVKVAPVRATVADAPPPPPVPEAWSGSAVTSHDVTSYEG